MTEEKEVLSQFGHEFIKNTRDRTFKIYEKLILDDVVYEMVDLVLFNVLNFLEENTQIEFKDENINAITDGLAGELYSNEGWIRKFSAYHSTEK